MKHYNDFLIVGIDHGYGNIKTANTVTPTGITKLDAAPTFTKNTLFFEGSYYQIGEGCGCPVDTSAKQKHRPRRQPRPQGVPYRQVAGRGQLHLYAYGHCS